MVQTLKLIIITSSKLHILYNILARRFITCEKKIEHHIILKGGGDESYDNGSKVFAYIFLFWYHNHIAIFSLYLLACTYHVKFQLMKNNYLCVTVGLLM